MKPTLRQKEAFWLLVLLGILCACLKIYNSNSSSTEKNISAQKKNGESGSVWSHEEFQKRIQISQSLPDSSKRQLLQKYPKFNSEEKKKLQRCLEREAKELSQKQKRLNLIRLRIQELL